MRTSNLVIELNNHKKDGMTIDEISKYLNVSELEAYSIISTVNRNKKWIKLDVKIIRTGKYGNSRYILVNNSTQPNDIIKNINRHFRGIIHHAKRGNELKKVGDKTRLTKELKLEFRELVMKVEEYLDEQWRAIKYEIEA
jgi:hypothetical protein